MDVLDSHKTKTTTSIARINPMQNMADLTSLCVNLDAVSMAMFTTNHPLPLYNQFLMMFIEAVNNRDRVDWYEKNVGNMPGEFSMNLQVLPRILAT
jgi:hypothetical protein